MDQQKRSALESIDQVSAPILKMSDDIWDAAELAYHETESARLQLELLKELGFEYSPEKSNVKNNGQMSVYYNAASELTVITLILSDKALLVAVTY